MPARAGGVRGVGWVGGGLAAVRRGAVSRAMIHVSDVYPTIVHGIAGLEVGVEADGEPPLDGVDAWPSITSPSSAATSARQEMLLQLNAGSQALRLGKYKVIVGLAGGPPKVGSVCSNHDDKSCSNPKCFP
jgi:arylsulfatase A-like enzyme